MANIHSDTPSHEEADDTHDDELSDAIDEILATQSLREARVAVVGRPNVGKSTLFNRLAGKKLAIVNDTPGVTRDRREAPARIGGQSVVLIDTAGFEDATGEALEARMRAQTEEAVQTSDVILFVYDARAGVTGLDEIFASFIRRANKPTVLVANKCESRASDSGIGEGYGLGLGDPIEVAAEHNIGMIELDDAVNMALREVDLKIDDENIDKSEAPVRIAVVGRPNAGKSTLINTLIGQDRLLTGPEAGVTRDAITIDWLWEGRRVQFHDTAGMRKKARVQNTLEKLSVYETLRAIKFAQVVVILMDPATAFDKQDMQIVDLCAREGRAMVLAVTKWDLVEDKSEVAAMLREKAGRLLPQVRGIPLVMFSGLTGRSINRLLPAIERVQIDWSAKIKTADLNDWLTEKTQAHPPPAANGRPVRLKYISQIKTRPPTFIIKCSRENAIAESYKRYLINGLRDDFDLPGIPIRIFIRAGHNPYA
jgi:GTP-binding protein